MTIYNILWYSFNWLEFVTYILIPTAIFLIILLYIWANFKLILLAWDLNKEILSGVNAENYHYNNYWINSKKEELIEDEIIEEVSIEKKNRTREEIQASLKITL